MSSPRELARRLAPLGPQRLRLLSCMGGDQPHLPQYVDLGPGEDALLAFRKFVERMVRTCAGATDRTTLALVAAGQLLTGELSAAGLIIESLPAAPVTLDHGAGHCALAAAAALQTALPLPPALRHSSRWLSGSSEQAALRAWLERHGPELVWDEVAGVYRFDEGVAAAPATPER